MTLLEANENDLLIVNEIINLNSDFINLLNSIGIIKNENLFVLKKYNQIKIIIVVVNDVEYAIRYNDAVNIIVEKEFKD